MQFRAKNLDADVFFSILEFGGKGVNFPLIVSTSSSVVGKGDSLWGKVSASVVGRDGASFVGKGASLVAKGGGLWWKGSAFARPPKGGNLSL